MRRRKMDFERDYEELLTLQEQSWAINFPDLEFSEIAFRRSLHAGGERGEVYVYEMDGDLVAWLWLDFSNIQLSGHVRHIQVKESHWGKKLGRRVMQDAIKMCLERGCRALTLNVTKSNERAVALYEHLGFVAVEDHGERQRMRLALNRHQEDELTQPEPVA